MPIQALGVVKHEIEGNVNFEIKSQFRQELREDTFSENKNDDAHEHVKRVSDIVSLFNILGTMADHSQKWYDGSSSRNIDSSSSHSEGITTIVSKLDSLGRDIKKLKENMHVIQVGCQTSEGAHLDKECPHNKEVKSMDEVKYGEFGRPFPNNSRNDGIFNKGISRYDQPSSGERRPSLTEIINKYIKEAAKRHAEQEEWLKRFY
ncbi:hypothetical protein Tco_1322056 [Tanacetum coccineum]